MILIKEKFKADENACKNESRGETYEVENEMFFGNFWKKIEDEQR